MRIQEELVILIHCLCRSLKLVARLSAYTAFDAASDYIINDSPSFWTCYCTEIPKCSQCIGFQSLINIASQVYMINPYDTSKLSVKFKSQ